MSHGSFLERLCRGTRWTWLADRHRGALPADLAATVMTLESRDRLHAKQGRTTARVVFHAPSGTGSLPVYLKRHYRLPWPTRLAALVDPGGRHSPGAAEWAHLERVRGLGIAVPEPVAAGERIGPWGALDSFLIVAELTGSLPLHEAVPALAALTEPFAFAAWKRALIREMARIVATLHRACVFHKDLYLCHLYLDTERPLEEPPRLTLIDLHRLGEHRVFADRWRWKDLGQLLFSTRDVPGIDDRDRLRFWTLYRRQLKLRHPRAQRRMIEIKAARYYAHNH
jgi:heptose I phosphotransferase